MILDTLKNAGNYAAIHEGINEVLKAVSGYTPENYETGKVEVDGDRIYYMRNAYATKEPTIFEAHKKYIDVMVMIEGEETIYVKPTSRLSNITMAYDSERDLMLAEFDKDGTPVHMTKGSFIVLMPQDAHAPGCWYECSKSVKKIVGKVRI